MIFFDEKLYIYDHHLYEQQKFVSSSLVGSLFVGGTININRVINLLNTLYRSCRESWSLDEIVEGNENLNAALNNKWTKSSLWQYDILFIYSLNCCNSFLFFFPHILCNFLTINVWGVIELRWNNYLNKLSNM